MVEHRPLSDFIAYAILTIGVLSLTPGRWARRIVAPLAAPTAASKTAFARSCSS